MKKLVLILLLLGMSFVYLQYHAHAAPSSEAGGGVYEPQPLPTMNAFTPEMMMRYRQSFRRMIGNNVFGFGTMRPMIDIRIPNLPMPSMENDEIVEGEGVYLDFTLLTE